jgi:hypothetical protein
VEAPLTQTGVELWIEHDMARHEKLPKQPAFVEKSSNHSTIE